MNERELHRLGKGDLIEIIYQLKKNEIRLTKELEEANRQLEQRELKFSDAGSIADAAVRISGVLEAAQQAADEYLSSVYSSNESTQAECRRMIEEAQAECDRMKREANEEIKRKWALFKKKANELVEANAELSSILRR